MSLNGLFDLLLLDADVALSHGGGGMLQKLLDQGNVIVAVLINLCGIELPEAVGADPLISQVVTDQLQLLLDGPGGDGEDQLMGRDSIVQAVAADELIEGKGDSEGSGLLGLLLLDGQAVSVSISHNVRKSQLHNIRNAESQVGFQDQGCGGSWVGSASCKALLHGVNDLFVLLCSEGNRSLVHGK